MATYLMPDIAGEHTVVFRQHRSKHSVDHTGATSGVCSRRDADLRVAAFAHLATYFLRCILKYSGHTIQHQWAFWLHQRDKRTVFMKKC